MATTSTYSSLYAKELKNIQAERDITLDVMEKKAEEKKVLSGGTMNLQATIGKFAKKSAESKMKEAFQFMDASDKLQEVKKFETVAGKTPELFDKMGSFGDVGKTGWESFESFTGMSWSGETTKLTSEYITAGLESGKGVSELGIGELTAEGLFPDIVTPDKITPGTPVPSAVGEIGHASYGKGTLGGTQGVTEKIAEWKSLNPDILTKGTTTVQQAGAVTDITSKAGDVVGTATLQEGGKIATEFSEAGIKSAAEGSATASVGAAAGKVAAGVGAVTGGIQIGKAIDEGDVKSGVSGGLKVVGGAMMFTPLAPVGMLLSGVGTLLDFV